MSSWPAPSRKSKSWVQTSPNGVAWYIQYPSLALGLLYVSKSIRTSKILDKGTNDDSVGKKVDDMLQGYDTFITKLLSPMNVVQRLDTELAKGFPNHGTVSELATGLAFFYIGGYFTPKI